MGAILGWRSAATVAAQPAAHVAKAGKPSEDMTVGRGVPFESVTWRELNGLYADVLFVEPPSTTCHSSRLATSSAVPDAPTPWRTQSSHPGGRSVPMPAPGVGAGLAPTGEPRSTTPSTTMASETPRRKWSKMRAINLLGGKISTFSRPGVWDSGEAGDILAEQHKDRQGAQPLRRATQNPQGTGQVA